MVQLLPNMQKNILRLENRVKQNRMQLKKACVLFCIKGEFIESSLVRERYLFYNNSIRWKEGVYDVR